VGNINPIDPSDMKMRGLVEKKRTFISFQWQKSL
jgi:hypothetical protein